MSAITSISWTDRTWNPVRGCARVSPGCERCYAEKVAHRFSKMVNGKPGPCFGLTVLGKKGVRWSGEARFIPSALTEPLSWRKPQRVFVNSMSDLFHEDISNEQIAAVWATMILGHWHTYQVLTKRADRMRAVLTDPGFYALVLKAADAMRADRPQLTQVGVSDPTKHPARNIWLGVSAEDQQRADERIPLLLQCPAAVRFVSAEPLLGPIDFTNHLAAKAATAMAFFDSSVWRSKLHWIIVGGESGPKSRAMNLAWARSIRDQCKEAGTAYFFKQTGRLYTENRGNDVERVGGHGNMHVVGGRITDDGTVERMVKPTNTKGGDLEEIPEDLRIREFPTPRAA